MHFVYCLYLDDIPFYVGITNDPVVRYKRHYHAHDCNTYNLVRHKAVIEGKMTEMKSSTNRKEVAKMEEIGITALRRHGFITYNRTNYNDPSELIESNFPHVKKFPHYILTYEIIKHVIDNTLNILEEYGYEEYRHKYLDYAKSLSKRSRNKRSKNS